jgi:hypothetical protein
MGDLPLATLGAAARFSLPGGRSAGFFPARCFFLIDHLAVPSDLERTIADGLFAEVDSPAWRVLVELLASLRENPKHPGWIPLLDQIADRVSGPLARKFSRVTDPEEAQSTLNAMLTVGTESAAPWLPAYLERASRDAVALPLGRFLERRLRDVLRERVETQERRRDREDDLPLSEPPPSPSEQLEREYELRELAERAVGTWGKRDPREDEAAEIKLKAMLILRAERFTQEQIATSMSVSVATVNRWLKHVETLALNHSGSSADASASPCAPAHRSEARSSSLRVGAWLIGLVLVGVSFGFGVGVGSRNENGGDAIVRIRPDSSTQLGASGEGEAEPIEPLDERLGEALDDEPLAEHADGPQIDNVCSVVFPRLRPDWEQPDGRGGEVGNTYPLSCNRGDVIVGLRGAANRGVTELEIVCASLEATRGPRGRVEVRANSAERYSRRSRGRERVPQRDGDTCRNGTVVSSITFDIGRGDAVNNVAATCGPVTVTAGRLAVGPRTQVLSMIGENGGDPDGTIVGPLRAIRITRPDTRVRSLAVWRLVDGRVECGAD